MSYFSKMKEIIFFRNRYPNADCNFFLDNMYICTIGTIRVNTQCDPTVAIPLDYVGSELLFAQVYFFYLVYTVIFVKQDKPTILSSFKPLQRGIAACMTCPSSKVIRSVHALLVKLMSTFPTESSKSVKNSGIYNYTGWPNKNRMAYFP